MGFVSKRSGNEDDGGGGGPELELDLDLRVCATCRRELLPWQDTCPDDGGEPVHPSDLPPPSDPVLERLLREGEQDVDPNP